MQFSANTPAISISAVLGNKNPGLALGIIRATIENSNHNPELWKEIDENTSRIRESLTFETIRDQVQIAATRKAYSACGKDPSRYRPSAEALMRRIVKGQGLYRINTLVDLINLVSLKTGYSIGGYDASNLEGNLELGLGRPDETYNGIGKGLLNIENLPVLRDASGPVGSPTSDSEKTSIQVNTSQFLMVIYAFDGSGGLQECMEYAVKLLKRYTGAESLHTHIVD
jgi:DNA/RNA-binding domain of Phe-tRNA-synthetase-like protein